MTPPADNTSRPHKRPRSEAATPSPRGTSPRVITPSATATAPNAPSTRNPADVSLHEANPSTSTSWNDWQGSSSLASMFLPPSDTLSKKSQSQPPIPPQDPIIAFPFNFGFSTAPKNEPNPTPGVGAGVDRTGGGLAIDPALSSLRSSADQRQVSDHNTSLPDIQITEETLAAASDQNSAALQAALEQARQEAAAMDMDTGDQGGSGSGSGGGGLVPPDNGDKKDQPFSRSPELKITHKLAERKRRKEMKDLFDELGDLLPAERGAKSSKWEVLSRAIDYVKSLKAEHDGIVAENQKLRREVEIARGGPSSSFTAPPNYQAYNLANYATDGTTGVQGDVNVASAAHDATAGLTKAE